MKLVIVTADTNDGDYIRNIMWDVKEEMLIEYRRIWKKLYDGERTQMVSYSGQPAKRMSSFEWMTGDMPSEGEHPEEVYKDFLTEAEIDTINSIAPYGDYGIHTIESLEIISYTNVERL